MANSSYDSNKTIWGLRDLGREISNLDLNRPYSSKDVLYLMNRFPFLKVLDADADLSEIHELPEPNFIRADSGWLMFDYGFYICFSLGELLYGSYSAEGEAEGEGIIELNPGKGTVVKQSFDTAAEMVALGKSHGWESIYILEGTELMGWAAWVVAEELGLRIEGYQPSQKDEEKRNRLKRTGRLEEMSLRLRL